MYKRLSLTPICTTRVLLLILTGTILISPQLGESAPVSIQGSVQNGGGGNRSGMSGPIQMPSGGITTSGESQGISRLAQTNTPSAGQIAFSNNDLVASFRVDGLYNLVGLGTWNGQPVSPTNMPSDDNRRLACTINFYVLQSDKNILYVQVKDVLTTIGAFWFGTAFTNVTQTGVRFTLPLRNRNRVIDSIESFSDQFANPDEVLVVGANHGTNQTGTEVTEPLFSTPGYTINVTPSGEFLIHTTNGGENGFTSLCCIFGATRIRGGGVFQITFERSLNIAHRIDLKSMTVEAEYGAGNQYIAGTKLNN